MPMNVWPTDAGAGVVANEARWRKMARLWAPSAVAGGIAGELKPAKIPAFPMVSIQAGACWADGHYCELEAAENLAVTPNGILVVRFDPSSDTAALVFRDNGTVPLQTTFGLWEVPIALMVSDVLTDLRGILPITGGAVVYPSVAVRDTNLSAASAPIGSTCLTADTGAQWNLNTSSGARRWTPPWNTAWGQLGYVSAVQSNIGAGVWVDINGMAISFTPVAGRLYEARVEAELQKTTTAGTVLLQITNGAGVLITPHGGLCQALAGINEAIYMHTRVLFTGVGVTTVKAQFQTSSGGVMANFNRGWFTLWDVGPATPIVT
jgi:hypothetical protein